MKSGAMALATMGLDPSFLRKTVFAQDLPKGAALNGNARGKVLIVLFQRGAADALNVVVPHGERAYYTMRPSIAIPRPAAGRGADGDRPRRILRAAPVAVAVQAAVGRRHSCADPRGRKSEQHALALRRAGLHGKRHARQQGHARRLAQSLSRGEGHVRRMPSRDEAQAAASVAFRAVAMTPQTPRILEGGAPTVAMNSLDEFTIRTNGIAGRTHRSAVSHRQRRRRACGRRRDVRGDEDSQVGESAAVHGRQRRRLSAVAVWQSSPSDRAAHQGRCRTRDRVRRRRRLGHARQSGRRDGPARAASRRFLEVDRRAGAGSRQPDVATSRFSRCRSSAARRDRTATAARITATRRRCSSSAAT